MPELPEVEAARRAVEEHCCGKRITKAIIGDDDKVIEGVSPAELQKALVGKRVVAAHRKGKNMWLELDTPPFPSFQFGMTGAVYIKGVSVTKYKRSAINDNDEWPSKFSKVFVELDDGLEMSFTDKRRLARVRLLENPEAVPPISELGPDALLGLMPEEDLINGLSRKKIAIKSLLLDQSFIAGIGNWVADEVLYQARIHPMQPASALSKESCKSLHKCIKEVIGKALEVGAESSQYPDNWIFHSREKKPGKAFVDGKKIDFITVGGRTSAYVPDLQKFDGPIPTNRLVKKGGNRSRKKKDAVESEQEEEEEEAEVGKVETKEGKGGRKPTKTAKAGTTKKGRHKKVDEIGTSEQDNEAQAADSGSQQGVEEEQSEEAKDESVSGKKGKITSKSTKARTKVTVSGEKGKRKTSAAKEDNPGKKGVSKKTIEHEGSKHTDAKVAKEVEQAKRSGNTNHKLNVSEQDEDEKLAKQPKKVGSKQQKVMEKESVEELVPEKNSEKSSDANSAKKKGGQDMIDQVNNRDASANTSEKENQGRKRKRGGKSN